MILGVVEGPSTIVMKVILMNSWTQRYYFLVYFKVEVEFGSGTLNGILATETFFVNGMEIPQTLFIEITDEEGDVFEDV